ncbi:hypothetical protein QF026_004833 [Streptomyces aurantiacus]|uniref:hypothetical protein n=1 Tax=Streptomyces aurantiacus TaxID=47760 RepID=UPI00278D95DA|nr:hypothetical protein [Streptomyces aurantiacus]MDQ0776367.1 hypothetical protein [Streptomyces aurantiacus]
MNAFLAELGKRAADRWLTLLVLPGALFLAVSGAGVLVLGHERWYDVRALAGAVNSIGGASRGTGQVLMFVVFLGLGASAVGLAARAVGGGVERLWLTTNRGRASRWLTARRRTRWSIADQRYRTALLRCCGEGSHEASAYKLDALLIARDRICPVSPERPTWMGDRVRATSERVHLMYDVDFASLWPRLWLCMPDATRAELIAARTALSAEARLFGWGLFYLPLAGWWWPSGVISMVTCLVAWSRGRTAAATLAELAESTVDLYGRDLAEQLGVNCSGTFSRDIGLEVTRILRKDG